MTNNEYTDMDKYIRAEQMTLGDLVLAHKRQFIVPLNQRPWAWKDAKDVQFFLEDFERTMLVFFDPDDSPKWSRRKDIKHPPHFFGTFVFFKRTTKEFEIFDGQQRMTAILMLCAVLREIAYSQIGMAGADETTASNVYGGFNNWLRLSQTTSAEPRLQPNTLFRPLFNALVFDSINEKERSEAFNAIPQDVRNHAISKKLRKSFYHIRSWVHERTDAYTPADATCFLRAAHDVLHDLFSCIVTQILDEQYSYEVFQCLNARGENLTAADNIKNELFKASEKADHNDISSKWNNISENVPKQDVGEFLRRRHIALIAPCKKNDVYDEVKEKEIDGKNPKSTIDQWYQDSQITKKILERKAGFAKKETLERLENIFDILGVGLAYIPLFAAAKVFLPLNKDKFHECVRIIEKYVFRTLTIGRMDTAELERKLGESARILTEKKSVTEFRDYLKEQSDDLSFQQKFATYVEKRRSKVQYYILRELEIELLGGGKGLVPGDHHSATNHIEHILPRNFSTTNGREHEWGWARNDPEKHRSLLNRLGNLLILESHIDKALGNHEFKVKQSGQFKKHKSGKVSKYSCYSNSALMWPKILCKTSEWPKWEEDDIERRQKQMAKDALKVWAL